MALQQHTAHLTEKYKPLLANYEQHIAHFTIKHEQLLANYEQLRMNNEQFRTSYKQLRQIVMNITSQNNASGNKKEEPVKAEVGSSN